MRGIVKVAAVKAPGFGDRIIHALCLPEQQARLDVIFRQQLAIGRGMVAARRLALTPARLKGIADDVRQVCNLADPVGKVIDGGL
ncbi:hypothetical protein ABKW02_23890, partial [Enterobacter cloacae]